MPALADRSRAAKRRFREIFPRGFADPTYLEWERDYKWRAHLHFRRSLGRGEMERLLAAGRFETIAHRAIAVYQGSKLNLLALYEWMALRDALLDPDGAAKFAPALHRLLYGVGSFAPRFESFVSALERMPQRQTRLAKWPVATLYPFLAMPSRHLLLKPNLMKRAAANLGMELRYDPRPNMRTYEAHLALARSVEAALASWHPRDLIDVQGFIWVTNSDEYAAWPWSDD